MNPVLNSNRPKTLPPNLMAVSKASNCWGDALFHGLSLEKHIESFVWKARVLIHIWLYTALVLTVASPVWAGQSLQVDLGSRSASQWQEVLDLAADLADPGGKIAFLSDAFLDTPYHENSLIGSADQEEILVMNLSGVDCFTLLDYVESFRRTARFSEVTGNLRQVRYQEGEVGYPQRNHFFSDWQQGNLARIVDVTAVVAQGRAVSVTKRLNQRRDGSLWLPGIPVKERRVDYIPTGSIDRQVLDALQDGDYIGIYSERPGLDVSHTGVIIKSGRHSWVRHASSQKQFRRVVDSDLLEFLQGKPGIVVYRAR